MTRPFSGEASAPLLKRESVSDSVEKLLMDRIASGYYRVGDRLPTERQLAESLGVSRTGVREALNRLQRMGLISTVRGQGGGSFIQEPDGRSLTDALSLLLKMRGVTKQELMEARVILSPVVVAVCGLAARRADDDDIEAMEELLASVDETHGEAVDAAVFSFQVRLSTACGNTVLQAAMLPLMNLVQPIADLTWRSMDGSDIRVLLDLLQEVLAAVKRRDSVKAETAMTRYMEQFGANLRALAINPPWLTDEDEQH